MQAIRINGAANECVTGSCLTHRVRIFWQSSERRWVHLDCFPCDPAAVARVVARGSDPAAIAEAEGDFGPGGTFAAPAAPARADGALFGAEEVAGAGEMPGQRSLFAGGAL